MYLWEILRNTLSKSLAAAEIVKEELKTAEDALQKGKEL
jgi:hypothetical protein